MGYLLSWKLSFLHSSIIRGERLPPLVKHTMVVALRSNPASFVLCFFFVLFFLEGGRMLSFCILTSPCRILAGPWVETLHYLCVFRPGTQNAPPTLPPNPLFPRPVHQECRRMGYRSNPVRLPTRAAPSKDDVEAVELELGLAAAMRESPANWAAVA